MVDRFLAWLGAGVLTAGVSAAMLAEAGLAIANDGSASSADGGTTSETSNSTGSTADSDDESAETPIDDADESTSESPDSTETDEDANGDEATVPDEDAAAKVDSDTDGTDRQTTAPVTPKPADTADDSDAAETEPEEKEEKAVAEKDEKEAAEASTEPDAVVQVQKSVVLETATAETEEGPEIAAVAFASAAEAEADATAAAPQTSGLLNLIGTIVFNLYGLVQRVAGGPPILPANSTVTVRSSTLVLECGCDEGDTIEVPADWYLPEGAEEDPPDQLIYLQHGFLAAGPWYSHTAAALAEQTNSIVVAPSITSNFLASDACWLGAPPMHQAMAKLFDDHNTTLTESALAAGYTGPIPDRVVLVGHSLGGGAVVGIAGAMADNLTADRLAGVVMLDGVPLDDTATESIEKVPDDIPIYNLAAPSYFWNQFGVGTDALHEARPEPGRFLGVTLVKGSHVDSMRGGNPLIQFSQELVAGYSHPENGAAAQILMVDWVNDMFAGVQQDPITEEFTIDTPAGPATAVPLPNELIKQFLLNPLQEFVSLGDGFFTFEPACVEESVASCSATMAA